MSQVQEHASAASHPTHSMQLERPQPLPLSQHAQQKRQSTYLNSPVLSHISQISHILIPESPVIDLGMPSPDHRTLDMGEGNGSGLTPRSQIEGTGGEAGLMPEAMAVPNKTPIHR